MEKHSHQTMGKHHHDSPYLHLLLMGLVHLPFMYVIMFVMVDSASDVYNNLNTFYMALMMVAPMIILMPLMMKDMYKDQKKNWMVYGSSLAALLIFYFFVRDQTLIGDRQFLRSMIPHHSGAVLMCEKAQLADQEIRDLCASIIKGQRDEVDRMRKILQRL